METKICNTCKLKKTLNEFHKSKAGKLGRCAICAKCYNSKASTKRSRSIYNEARKKRRANPEYRQEENKYMNNLNHKDPLKYLLKSAKARAKKKNIAFTITDKDINLVEFCPLLGLKLQMNWERKQDNSYSIDRIDNTKGYIPENVWIISEKANRIKNTASLDEIIKMAENIRNLQK